jgi:hypothetical protein
MSVHNFPKGDLTGLADSGPAACDKVLEDAKGACDHVLVLGIDVLDDSLYLRANDGATAMLLAWLIGMAGHQLFAGQIKTCDDIVPPGA